MLRALSAVSSKLRLSSGTAYSQVEPLCSRSVWRLLFIVQLLSYVRHFVVPIDCSTPGFPVLRYLPEFAQTHVHRANDDMQPSHPLSAPSRPASISASIKVFSNESGLHIRWHIFTDKSVQRTKAWSLCFYEVYLWKVMAGLRILHGFSQDFCRSCNHSSALPNPATYASFQVLFLNALHISQMQTQLPLYMWFLEHDSWRRQVQPTPLLLPGKSHGCRSLVGCSPWGREESDTTEWLHFHFSLSCTGEGNGNPLQCSCLENPRDGGAWWTAVYGVAQSWTRLKRLSSSSSRTW